MSPVVDKASDAAMGSVANVEGLYRRYFPVIRERCHRLLREREEAQDVAQETFIRLWKVGPVDKEPKKVLAWAYRTSNHLAIDRMRSRRIRRESAASVSLRETGESPALSSEEALETRRVLERLARDIPRKELEVALMCRVDRMTHSEVAQVLGTSDRGVRRALERFDRRTAELFKEERWRR